MPYSEPTNLGIVACPGGQAFASEVIVHLRHMYKHRFNLKRDTISKRYGFEKEELVKSINLYNDMQTSDLCVKGNVENYRAPEFLVDAEFTYFMNGEFKTEIKDCIRGKDIFIFQDVENHQVISLNGGKNKMALSVNDHLMSLIVTIDAVRQAGASGITLVLPVYPYSRQHKKKGREGLTASLLGHIYENMGVKRIITLDIHSREIENAFGKANIENLHASYQIIRELSHLFDLSPNGDDLVIVSPDTGAVDRNKFYATDVKGKVAFLADDMLGTGGTLLKAMEFLKEQGATKVIAAISLPFFTGNAIEQFNAAYEKGLFYRVIGTNAVYHEELLKCEWYINTNVSGLFANVIARLHHNQSLSDLLDNRNIIEKLVKHE